MFLNRKDAGEQLANLLRRMDYQRPLVLGIPRGGVPVALEVARALDGDLAVVVARKLGAPGYPELAIGAVTATGASYINDAVADAAGASPEYIEAEKERQVREARRREALFDGHRRPPVQGRVVIVVDDGVATGATAIAAVRSIKAEGAARVVLAIPVGPPDMVELLRHEADEVVCLEEDADFGAVGYYYEDFGQVSDAEVRATLEQFAARVPAGPSRPVQIDRDGVHLAGTLSTPDGDGPFPLVIFVHGLGSSKDSPRNVTVASHLVDAGIATLLFDLSGHGESSADPDDGIDAYVDDLQAVFAWAVEQDAVIRDDVGVAGSSLGAMIAARALADGRISPRTMVLRGPAMEPSDFQGLEIPCLVLVGSRDPLRPDVERGAVAIPNVTLSVVEGASHLFEEPGALEEAVFQMVGWFRAMLLRPAHRGAVAL